MTDKELLQQSLDALKMSYELQDIGWVDFEAYKLTCDADILSKLNITIDAIKARLAQPDCICGEPNSEGVHRKDNPCYMQPKKEWVGLTDEEVIDIWAGVSIGYDDEINIVHLGKAIEAKLKEKNT